MAERFGKWIVPVDAGKGRVFSAGGELFTRPESAHPVTDYLTGLQSIVILAFPEEFEGSEGKAEEDRLTGEVRQRFPGQTADEAYSDSVAHYMSKGKNADQIAALLVTQNKRVQTALKLANMDDDGKKQACEKIADAVRSKWPHG